MWKATVLLFGVAAIAVLSSWIVYHQKQTKGKAGATKSETTSNDIIYSDCFTLSQAKQWVKKKLSTGNRKAAIIKSKSFPPELRTYFDSSDIVTDDEQEYLLMVCQNTQTGKLEDILIVEYDSLENELEELLGNEGMVVINGGEK